MELRGTHLGKPAKRDEGEELNWRWWNRGSVQRSAQGQVGKSKEPTASSELTAFDTQLESEVRANLKQRFDINLFMWLAGQQKKKMESIRLMG